MQKPALIEKRLPIGCAYHCPINAAVSKQHRKIDITQKMRGSEYSTSSQHLE